MAVSGTESIYNSAAALAADPLNEDTGIIEDVIPSILLPQVGCMSFCMLFGALSARDNARLGGGDGRCRHAEGLIDSLQGVHLPRGMPAAPSTAFKVALECRCGIA